MKWLKVENSCSRKNFKATQEYIEASQIIQLLNEYDSIFTYQRNIEQIYNKFYFVCINLRLTTIP